MAISLRRHCATPEVWTQRIRQLSEIRSIAANVNAKHFGIIQSPSGECFEVMNLAQFCQKHHLTIQLVHNVFASKQKTHKGWKLPPEKMEE